METSQRGRNASREDSLAPNSQTASTGRLSSSATSVASSSELGDAPRDWRPTLDGTGDKSKRSSEDGHSETSSHRRRISKLFKKGRRRRMSDLSQADAGEEMPPPLPDRDTRDTRADPLFHSQESLPLHKSVASSLLTDDSDVESASPVAKRPTISPHQSHAGYLTLSSPLINSETVDSGATATTNADSAIYSHLSSADLDHAKTIDNTSDVKRSASPVGKLKEAFSPQRTSTPPKAGEPADIVRSGFAGDIGGVFGRKRSGSKVLDDTIVLQASPPQIHEESQARTIRGLSSTTPKRIITQIPATPPSLAAAPETFVTPPTPTDARPPSPGTLTSSARGGSKTATAPPNPNVVVSPSGNMISHRRVRSGNNHPSRLSNSITAPLTPTLEEVKTPGGTAGPPQSPTGFFSSVFSAAQNAANTLSTTIANSAAGKNKANQQKEVEEKTLVEAGGEEVIGPENVVSSSEAGAEKRRLAVETLGSGELSLAHLGINESSDPSPMSSLTNPLKTADDVSVQAEDLAATQAITAAYANDKAAPVVSERPRSLTTASGGSLGAAASPSRQDILDSPAQGSIQRQGSIRSRISGGRRRRHRGSSATTGNTIAGAIGASTSTLIPSAPVNGQRLNGTGFAVASPKRNRDFHSLFKSVPEDDYLIEDYSAALQKEILLQGRLYVSEGHLCFSSNILGWVTNLVISFDEVVSVEKKSTAMLFPNGIVIQTLHARNIFASFLSRDSTYDLIIGIWKISHPNLKSSLNGVTLDGSGTGDKTEKAESVGSEDGSIQDSDEEVYDEDAEEEEEGMSFTEAGEGSVAGSEQESVKGVVDRKASATVAQAVSGGPSKLSTGTEAAIKEAAGEQDFPGPANHGATECGDGEQHYDKLLIDTTIPAPLGKIYSLMFGPASGVFMRKWLIEDQKSLDLQMEEDKQGLGESKKSFSYSYIKPLPGSIGPKQTKCNINMTLEQYDLDRAVTVLCSTGTPDVPSGNSFLTKTRYCLSWGPGNSTRLIMTFTVEWSAKSWLKGPIEKGANDGQLTYATAITSALRAAVSAKLPVRIPGKGVKGKKRSKAQILDDAAPAATPAPAAAAKPKEKSWGLLDPLRSLLGPVADLIDYLLDSKVLAGLLFLLLIWTWFFRAPGVGVGLPHTPAGRIAAYEQIWASEESELWKWMEERVALDRVHAAAGGQVREAGDLRDRLAQESMGHRQIDEAIRVTQDRLEALKFAVQREREGKGKKSGDANASSGRGK